VNDNTVIFFLLQNWWSYKQYVEVDETYLIGCGATVHFIRQQQQSIPTKFPCLEGFYFEAAEGAEGCESTPEEGKW